MKLQVQKRFAFIGKSLLWSLLLYVVMMVTINWDDVSRVTKDDEGVTIINTTTAGTQVSNTHSNISLHSGLAKSVIAVLKTVTGFSVSVFH